MQPDKLIPLISTHELAEVRRFYTEVLGFRVVFEHPEYLGLKAEGEAGPELSFMPPCPGRPVANGQGLTCSFEVRDVEREHQRLRDAGVPIVQPLRDNPWGDRSFVVLDPLGISLYVYTPTAPRPEFAACVKG